MAYAKSKIEELNEVLADLHSGKTATPVTIRTFLWWFRVQRRTPSHVQHINDELQRLNIRTIPDYRDIWVDTPITFEITNLVNSDDIEKHVVANNEEILLEGLTNKSAEDPSFRIGKIPSANIPPTFVSPNSSLAEAITIMLARNFSQLPVMTSEREVKGIISWSSIGARSIGTNSDSTVRSFMDDHQEISVSASLFSGIKIILEHNYVLIRAADRKICGIVTSNDMAFQFEEISTPFLLISEIENSLRNIIGSKITIDDIRNTCDENHLPSELSDVSDLTFGNYVKILEHTDNWAKIGLNLDRKTFCSELMEINAIRNDVMHFDPDPLKLEDLNKLRNISKLLIRLKEISAY
ncbi:CBS domain-containing protein [Methylobacterium sp. J-068]|uniref:CBS domain-containing protein n=1 Tax=Methylobacterium sp. J-068 TaxID=2836649 RepID=UPI001FBB748A|nr:CBS domain-containing protein [Methylobacterium sp. J-068]MCJ2035071.1 CBS domain-containing protein [Methylobacterium sp. J-068]